MKSLDPELIVNVSIAVLLVGILMSWGYRNDIPILKHAADGYDQ